MKIEKVAKLVANLHDKGEYVIQITNLKQALNHWLVLKKVHRSIKFNRKVWLNSYININRELIKKGKTDFEKDFFKLKNNAVFVKTLWKGWKHMAIKRATTEKIKTYLVSEHN